MILRSTNKIDYELDKSITVEEFIKEVIERDDERHLKYYGIILNAELYSRNMVLYYQDGVLKSHHSSGLRMDYNDYLDCEITKKYVADYITVANIRDFKKDYDGEDGNKPRKIVNKGLSKEMMNKMSKSLEESIEKSKREQMERDIINKVTSAHTLKEVTFEDLVRCVSQIAAYMDTEKSNKINDDYCLNWTIDGLREENRVSKDQIKWLEYKVDLLQNIKKSKYRDKRIKYLEDELVRNGIRLQEKVEHNAQRKLLKPRKSGSQKFEETLAKLKEQGKIK